MGNSVKGVFDLPAGDAVYKIRFGMNEIIELEEKFDRPATQIFTEMMTAENFRFRYLRDILHAGLQEHHPDVTEKEAGNIITEVGVTAASRVLMEAVMAAFPDTVVGEESKNTSPGKTAKNAKGRTGEDGPQSS